MTEITGSKHYKSYVQRIRVVKSTWFHNNLLLDYTFSYKGKEYRLSVNVEDDKDYTYDLNEIENTEMNRPNLQESKRAVCDWIMAMQVRDYFEFMNMVLENTDIPAVETITGEMFFSCRQCTKEHEEECERLGIDDGTKCYQFFCEHYGI